MNAAKEGLLLPPLPLSAAYCRGEATKLAGGVGAVNPRRPGRTPELERPRGRESAPYPAVGREPFVGSRAIVRADDDLGADALLAAWRNESGLSCSNAQVEASVAVGAGAGPAVRSW